MVDNSQKKELCIVHIGMPKTGSSTLQKAFSINIEDKRVSYINLQEGNQGCILYGIFMDNPETFHYFASKGWKNKKIQEFSEINKNLLIEGFLNHNSSIEILSGEDLFHFSENSIKKLKLFLDKYFKNIIIVAYVRPVKTFVESAFQQLVKYHDLGSFDFNKIYHKYANFKRYDNVFGSKNVKLWKFEPKLFPEGDILLDFCSKLNLKSSRSKEKIVNESLSQEAISILFTYHFHKNCKTDFGTNQYKINNRLIEEVRSIGSTRFRFSGKLIKNVIENHIEDYDWIRERMNDNMDEKIDFDDANGINSEFELMQYSTNYIDDLLILVDKENIVFKIDKSPQTVAKLIDLLMIKISNKLRKDKYTWL